jgi:hypothetical protein
MLMLLSMAFPALARTPGNCCQPVIEVEAACCETVASESAEVCEPACYIVCERPPGVDPFQGSDGHHYQLVLICAVLPQPTPPIVAVSTKAVTERADKHLPRDFELDPEAHPNPPPQLL